MYIAILGRQPALGMGELEHLYGSDNVSWFSDGVAKVTTNDLSVDHLGGSQKVGRVVAELPRGDWRQASVKIVQAYRQAWETVDYKITLGISVYGFDTSTREVQKTGLVLKQKLKQHDVSLRLIPNNDLALSTATAHHNKLGLSQSKVELIVVRSRSGRIIIAESVGAQNITAYAKRDQGRPKRDAFVGMLPPKLAQIMINLAVPANKRSGDTHLLDPFCGTGVLLQEAALIGLAPYGTDLSSKMIDFSKANLEWLAATHHIDTPPPLLQVGDAMDMVWQQPIDAVACESYLGQPFSAPPSPSKLDEVRKNCDHIISSFLRNIARQIDPGTPLCVGVPAWKAVDGSFTHLPLINNLEKLGFKQHPFKNIKNDELLYFREDQVVARELLVIVRE